MERIMDLFERTAAERADSPALRALDGGAWRTTTWREYREQVRLAARGFMALGLEPGACVVIIGSNRPEWFVADLGAVAAGGIPVGLYTTSTPEQCRHIAAHCEATVAVVENEEQLAKFRAVRHALPALSAVVLMRGEDRNGDARSWRDLLRLGETVPETLLDQRIAAQRPDDVATLIYTSGTTGTPKGVMLTHDNITWTAHVGETCLAARRGDHAVSYLPLSHIAEQITTLFGAIAFGGCVTFAPSMEHLGETLREVRPHYFLGVPRVWEKIQQRMQAVGAQSPRLRKKIVAWARTQGLAGGYATQHGGKKPLLYQAASRLVFSKARQKLGLDRARTLVTSAAPISRDTLEFFLSLGMPICEVYGMSECTGPATISTPDCYRTGKAGVCVPGAELKIADDGEICMRGRHVFRGYFKDPAATADALDADGWLHSGDIGELDSEGFLSVTDRKKDLIITAGGENIAPQLIEGQLKSIAVVSQAVVIGDRRRYLSVLLTLDPEKIPAEAALAGSTARDVRTAAECERFIAHLQRQIDDVNSRLARVQTVKKFAVIPGEFTIDGGELTPTMKVRRKVVSEKYAGEIERLYS